MRRFQGVVRETNVFRSTYKSAVHPPFRRNILTLPDEQLACVQYYYHKSSDIPFSLPSHGNKKKAAASTSLYHNSYTSSKAVHQELTTGAFRK